MMAQIKPVHQELQYNQYVCLAQDRKISLLVSVDASLHIDKLQVVREIIDSRGVLGYIGTWLKQSEVGMVTHYWCAGSGHCTALKLFTCTQYGETTESHK